MTVGRISHVQPTAAAVVMVVIAVLLIHHASYVRVEGGTRIWSVMPYSNSTDAAKLLDMTNARMIEILRHIKKKYAIDQPGAPTHTSTVQRICDTLLDNYNPDVFRENDPVTGSGTSYTLNKGSKMMICLRSKADPNVLVDPNVLLFVVLHESAHIANYRSWQHDDIFWSTFKFLLQEAQESGVYVPVDYASNPVVYCGMTIDYNPLFDASLGPV